ncbi:hypothetical protein [Sediminibacillus albus]|uniref:Uncharacterized protein n=1 Tax=Sediminibacillus albus TaxID=407036 RepID=A0A1G8ZI36_9BACI|nr:hypothetical protein [Sediminibacillus albus]SDK14698.1 hypothetical protein SAMN05216243_2031 [Sediminibacillus albus]
MVKRFVSLLALLVVLALVQPVAAFAEEGKANQYDASADSPTSEEGTEAPKKDPKDEEPITLHYDPDYGEIG